MKDKQESYHLKKEVPTLDELSVNPWNLPKPIKTLLITTYIKVTWVNWIMKVCVAHEKTHEKRRILVIVDSFGFRASQNIRFFPYMYV